jgi:hypothetical protein
MIAFPRRTFRKPDWRRPFGRHLGRHMGGWKDNIRMDLREIGGEMRTGCIWLRTGTCGELL